MQFVVALAQFIHSPSRRKRLELGKWLINFLHFLSPLEDIDEAYVDVLSASAIMKQIKLRFMQVLPLEVMQISGKKTIWLDMQALYIVCFFMLLNEKAPFQPSSRKLNVWGLLSALVIIIFCLWSARMSSLSDVDFPFYSTRKKFAPTFQLPRKSLPVVDFHNRRQPTKHGHGFSIDLPFKSHKAGPWNEPWFTDLIKSLAHSLVSQRIKLLNNWISRPRVARTGKITFHSHFY